MSAFAVGGTAGVAALTGADPVVADVGGLAETGVPEDVLRIAEDVVLTVIDGGR